MKICSRISVLLKCSVLSQFAVESVSVTKDFLTYMVLEFYWKHKSREFAHIAANKLKWMCFLTVSLGHSFPVQPFRSSNN